MAGFRNPLIGFSSWFLSVAQIGHVLALFSGSVWSQDSSSCTSLTSPQVKTKPKGEMSFLLKYLFLVIQVKVLRLALIYSD